MSEPNYKHILEYYRKHRKGLEQNSVLIPLTNVSVYFAHIIFRISIGFISLVNFKEVNIIQSKFLTYLEQNHSKTDTISATDLLDTMSIRPIPILVNYFSYCQGEVDVNSFFQFICLFSFFSIQQLLPIILSICKIQSNKSLNDGQIIEIFRQLDSLDFHYQILVEWLHCCDRNEEGRITIPTFVNFFLKHNDFTVSLSLLKCRIEQYIFDQETYYNILRRKLYYSNYIESLPEIIQNDNAIIITPPQRPQEGCSNYLYRILISKEPHPYLTNYFNVNIVRSVHIFLNKIRSRYGYSSRPVNMSSSVRLKSQYSDKSIRRQSKQMENNNNNNSTTSPKLKKTKILSPLAVVSPNQSSSFTASNTTTAADNRTAISNSHNNNSSINVEVSPEKKKKDKSQRHSDSFIRLSNNANSQEQSSNYCSHKNSRALIYLIPSPSSRFNNVGSPKKKTLNKAFSNSCFSEEEED